MPTPFTARYVHRLVLEQKARAARGQLEPDRKLHAVSAVSPDKRFLYVLVNECRLGITSAALFKSVAPGQLDYAPEEVEEDCRGTQEFVERATVLAREHTQIPAVVRRYPDFKEEGE